MSGIFSTPYNEIQLIKRIFPYSGTGFYRTKDAIKTPTQESIPIILKTLFELIPPLFFMKIDSQ